MFISSQRVRERGNLSLPVVAIGSIPYIYRRAAFPHRATPAALPYMREHPGTLRQKPRKGNQTQASNEFVRPTAIIPARDAFELHRANSGANPMVEEPELVCDRGKGSGEVVGIPDEDTVEFSKDIRTEVMRASSEQAHPRFEFLDGLIADGNSAFGNVKAEEVKPFEEGSDFRLVGGKGETQLDPQESIHESQSLFSLGVRTAQDHEIIGVAHEAVAGLCQTLVETVENDVSEEGTDDAALRSAGSGGVKLESLHHARREKLTDNAQDVAVSDALGDTIEDEVMGDVVEESLDVGVHNPFVPGGVSRAESLNRLVSVTARTEAKRELREVRLEEGFEKRTNHLLSHAVSDRRDAHRTKFAIPFGDEDPAERGGAIAFIVLEVEHQGGKIVVQVGFKSANTDFVHPGNAAIAFDGKKSAAHSVEVNQPGKGVGFRQLDGQETFLTAWRCCEAERQEPTRHSRTD